MNSLPENQSRFDGWRGVGLIAISYVFFLIFAQFGFLKRLSDLGIAGDGLKMIMGAMATGGIAGSLFVPRLVSHGHPGRWLQLAFLGCASGAAATLLPLNVFGAAAVSALIGFSLGILTVTLVTHLNLWIGNKQPLLKIGLGVGLAYFVCNFPPLFEAAPQTMAIVCVVLCAVGILIATSCNRAPDLDKSSASGSKSPPFLLALACFTALVWLDSAAFFIIQNTPALKSGTWEGAQRLWQNGGVHLIAALCAAVLLHRRGLPATLSVASIFLGCACLLLIGPSRAATASVFYPIGVSLYSVALVAYPAFLAPPAPAKERARRAAWLYAVAGWIGSGLGIGMGENLRRIPPTFVIAAAMLFFAPAIWNSLRQRGRELLTLGVLFGGAWVLLKVLSPETKVVPALEQPSLVERGREVYISEGCIHCHSQYVRPNSTDEIMWGTATDAAASRTEQPPLIGNRRQGPDLSTVGNRRSALWLKAHFISPRAVSPHSPMPAYARLFADDRGDALMAYVQSLGRSNLMERLSVQSTWRISEPAATNHLNGATLVQMYCATCHSPEGLTRRTWPSSFRRLPPDFVTGPFLYAPATVSPEWRLRRLTEIIKFGLPGTDMPGHEYLADATVAALARQVAGLAEKKRP